jgi:CDP-6-deoxy-D-xylo-4-hexulose-3-dehydrase
MKTIEESISELIDTVGKDHSVLKYVYNKGSNFVPGVTPVYYSGPYFTDNEEIVQGIKTLLTGSWIASGEEVRKFEIEFARKINQKHALMLNSGSSANLVLIAATKKHLNWNDGDEIITSVVGFPTTIAPIVQNNMVPVFVDIEMDSLNFDISKIEEKITKKTRAIFLSPVLGNPPNMDELVDICTPYISRLFLIIAGVFVWPK